MTPLTPEATHGAYLTPSSLHGHGCTARKPDTTPRRELSGGGALRWAVPPALGRSERATLSWRARHGHCVEATRGLLHTRSTFHGSGLGASPAATSFAKKPRVAASQPRARYRSRRARTAGASSSGHT